jgi:hypothetical protein
VRLGHLTYCLYWYFVNFVNLTCCASQPVEPAQTSSPHFTVTTPEADMVKLSSSDTKQALNLLFLSAARDSHSPVSNLCSGSDSGAFKDCPESNDMAASVYVVLTADASSSHASLADSSCAGHKHT